MPDTPRFLLTHLPGSTADGEVLHNLALEVLDCVVQLRVLDRNLDTPPAAANGDAYIVASPATGEWTGWENWIALFSQGSWIPIVPPVGTRAWIEDDKIVAVWDGVEWQSRTGDNSIGLRSASNQTLGGGGTNVQWNTELRKDGPYAHDTGSNPDQITLIEAGDYQVTVDVTVAYTAGAGEQRFKAELTLDGSGVAGSESYGSVNSNTIRTTVSITMAVTATAGQILRVLGTHLAGGGTIDAAADACRILVRRL